MKLTFANSHYFLLYSLVLIVVFIDIRIIRGHPPTQQANLGDYQVRHISDQHIYYHDVPIISWEEEPILFPAISNSQVATALMTVQDRYNPFAPFSLSALTIAEPTQQIQYQLTLANFERFTHTYRLTNTVPVGIEVMPHSVAPGLAYDMQTRTFSWQGTLEPGHLDYIITTSNDASLPYLDLADFGLENLCNPFINNDVPCDDVLVTFNLGISNRSVALYGETMSEIVLSSNGIALVNDDLSISPHIAHNQWLPDSENPGHLFAGLWRDNDLTARGRWHAAIITGWIVGHDVFYAQWHDAPHQSDMDSTVRHAIAIILNGNGDSSGDIYYIYDNVSNPVQTIRAGYTIGIEDKLGTRGVTWAYAACCNDVMLPQGSPPESGTILKLQPVLFGASNDYTRTFTYTAMVTGAVPEMVANTAFATSDSSDPAINDMWHTHYLFIRWQYFLPLIALETEYVHGSWNRHQEGS